MHEKTADEKGCNYDMATEWQRHSSEMTLLAGMIETAGFCQNSQSMLNKLEAYHSRLNYLSSSHHREHSRTNG